MDITKLVPNIEEIRTKVDSRIAAEKDDNKVADLRYHVFNLLGYVAQYKNWQNSITNYAKDTSLQKLPLEYYQICARQTEFAYEQAVPIGIPKLLELGIVDKDGKVL